MERFKKYFIMLTKLSLVSGFVLLALYFIEIHRPITSLTLVESIILAAIFFVFGWWFLLGSMALTSLNFLILGIPFLIASKLFAGSPNLEKFNSGIKKIQNIPYLKESFFIALFPGLFFLLAIYFSSVNKEPIIAASIISFVTFITLLSLIGQLKEVNLSLKDTASNTDEQLLQLKEKQKKIVNYLLLFPIFCFSTFLISAPEIFYSELNLTMTKLNLSIEGATVYLNKPYSQYLPKILQMKDQKTTSADGFTPFAGVTILLNGIGGTTRISWQDNQQTKEMEIPNDAIRIIEVVKK